MLTLQPEFVVQGVNVRICATTCEKSHAVVTRLGKDFSIGTVPVLCMLLKHCIWLNKQRLTEDLPIHSFKEGARRVPEIRTLALIYAMQCLNCPGEGWTPSCLPKPYQNTALSVFQVSPVATDPQLFFDNSNILRRLADINPPDITPWVRTPVSGKAGRNPRTYPCRIRTQCTMSFFCYRKRGSES